jgi:predicted deacylase
MSYGVIRTEDEALTLISEQERLTEMFDSPIVYSRAVPDKVVDLDTGYISTCCREALDIPAFTVELGGHSYVKERRRRTGVTDLRNVLRELDMFPGDPVKNETGPQRPGRRPRSLHRCPHADTPGISQYQVDVLNVVEPRTPVADIVTPHGEHRKSIKSEHEGFVIGRYEGLVQYKSDALTSLAVRDAFDRVAEVSE